MSTIRHEVHIPTAVRRVVWTLTLLLPPTTLAAEATSGEGNSAARNGEARPARVMENVSYGHEAPEAQVLTAFLVRSPRPSPVLVQIISGGWNSAPPRGSDPQAVRSYLDAGLSVVIVAHRPVNDSVHWPAPAEDVARAIQYVRSQADAWHIDPTRIAVKGRSSGGHVALMVGFGPDRAQPDSDDPVLSQSSRPTCIVAGSAPTDFPRHMRELLQGDDRQEYLRGRLRALLGLGDAELPLDQLTSRLEPLSPFHIVTRDAPPVLLSHPGPADAYWPGDPRLKWDVHTPITGFILAERLKELGVPHQLVMMPEDSSGRGSGQVPAEELAFLKRYLELPKDAPRPTAREAIDAGKSGPRPTLPRLALEGLPPPEPGRPGVLGFRVRAPWMRGWIEQRFPETIHSSLGLHFIDHRRPDMPPLSMLDPFPAWDRDEATGEISYAHKDRTGLVFSGRARPSEDQVVLEYRIRNETGAKLHNISAQMCTNLGPSPDFDPKEDVTRTFTWVDGQWTSLADTTPNLTRTGRHPWILMQVRGTDYGGPRENPDGWWVADQIADHGIAARVTRDGEHLAAVHWDSAPMVMSNSRIPCLHAGPAGGVSLDPGQEVVWRGTIYLMKNDPDQLLSRYLAARENLEPSDRQPPTAHPMQPDRAAPPVRQARERADRPASQQQDDGPFQIVRSFPVSEATWAAKVGELYLVAAQRSVLVYRKTGPAATDYREVNRIFPGVDGRIENCEIAGQWLYVPASGQGLLAYRLEDLEKPDVQPIARYAGPRRIGAISVAGGRVYAAYREGGLGVFDARTLELLGEGLLETGIGRAGLTAVPGGVVYTTRVPEYGELLVVDARNPDRLSAAGRVRNAAYATHYRFPGPVAGDRMYMPEGNGGVGVYDITDPLQPLLQRRHAAVGDSPPRGARALPGQVRAFAVQDGIGYLVRDREVVAVRLDADGFEELGAVSQSKLSGAGLLDPQAVSVREGVAAIPTTMEGVRFIDGANVGQPEPLLTIDLPSRFEGLAKVGRMVYATADIDGVWQIDWEAADGPRLSRRIETRPKALPGESLAEDLTLHRNHLYVADGLGLAVMDVSDEDDPRQVFYWDYPYPGGVPDISAGWVEGVGVGGDTLYATLGPAGLATFDV
ncbi:MAG: hypothetical protein FJ276_20375, partial [Planctomycetes bacterium]|nr:hypothetical protein [Planctomycetota bacterium]